MKVLQKANKSKYIPGSFINNLVFRCLAVRNMLNRTRTYPYQGYFWPRSHLIKPKFYVGWNGWKNQTFLAYFGECWSRVTRSLSKSDIDSRLNVAFRFLVFPIAVKAFESWTLGRHSHGLILFLEKQWIYIEVYRKWYNPK